MEKKDDHRPYGDNDNDEHVYDGNVAFKVQQHLKSSRRETTR